MEEVTIKLTMEEANELRLLIKHEILEIASITYFLKAMGGNTPDFVGKKNRVLSNLCDKIDAAFNAY